MPKRNSRQDRDRRFAAAAQRQASWDQLSTFAKLSALKKRPGKSTKERTRLLRNEVTVIEAQESA